MPTGQYGVDDHGLTLTEMDSATRILAYILGALQAASGGAGVTSIGGQSGVIGLSKLTIPGGVLTSNYDPAAVAITGGSINNTTVGAGTPNTVAATTLNVTTGGATIEASGDILTLTHSAVTKVRVNNAGTVICAGLGSITNGPTSIDLSGGITLQTQNDSVYIKNQGAGISLVVQNGTTAQALGITLTYTDASNYSRVKMNAGSTFAFSVDEAGTGVGANTGGYSFDRAVFFPDGDVANPAISSAGKGAGIYFAGGFHDVFNVTISGSQKLRVQAGSVSVFEDLLLVTAGKGLQLQSGAGQRGGSAVLVGGTVTVTNTTVGANTQILLTVKTAGGTLGSLSYTISNGASFTINSSSVIDTSTVEYFIFELN